MTGFNPEPKKKPLLRHPSRLEDSPFPETPEELAEAKQLAGVTTREESRTRFFISELAEEPESIQRQKIQELVDQGTPGLRNLLLIVSVLEKEGVHPLLKVVERVKTEALKKIRDSIFPHMLGGVKYSNQVRADMKRVDKRSYPLRDAMARLDQLMGNESSPGILFFDYLPASTTLDLEKSVTETVSIKDERERIIAMLFELERELTLVATSEALSTLPDPKDRTFIKELAAALSNPPRGDIANISRPPLNQASLDRCLRVIATLDPFSDIDDYKIAPGPVGASPAQVLAAVYLRERALPQEKNYFQLILRRAAEISDAYMSVIEPADKRTTPMSKVHHLYKEIIASGKQTAKQMTELNLALNDYSLSWGYYYQDEDIIAFKEKYDQVMADREAERLASQQEPADDSPDNEMPVGKKGIPEIIKVGRRTIKQVRTAPLPDESGSVQSLESSYKLFTDRMGKKFMTAYRLDQLSPAEFSVLNDLLQEEAEERVRAFVKEGAEEALKLLLSSSRLRDSLTPAEVGSLHAYVNDPASADVQVVGSTLIKIFGLPWENRYMRNQNLPEPFDQLPAKVILTELFLRQVVEKHRAPEEAEVAFTNIQHFLTFDKQVVQKKKTAAELGASNIPFVRAKLKSLKGWYERNHSFSRRQRRYVHSLCSQYQREVEPLL